MEYTKRRITYPADKLPALSGVASIIQKVTGSEYFTGLWVENFIADLCWYRVWIDEGLDKWEPSWVLPSSYRAPSFSWASVEGAVIYSEEYFYANWTWHASVLERSLDLSGKNSLGQVKSSSIKIRGPILLASLTSMPDNLEHPFNYSLCLDVAEEEDAFVADVMLEEYTFSAPFGSPRRSIRRSTKEANQLFESVPVYVLSLGHYAELARGKKKMMYRQIGLVLGVSPMEPLAYERLGFIEFYGRHTLEWKRFFKGTTHETITLI
jgi:hypothetical protein